MASIVARDLYVEFPIYDTLRRSFRHEFGLKHIFKSEAMHSGRRDVGASIEQNQSGRVVVQAVQNVSFSIEQGDRVGVLGRNGSGKTTLLRTLAGIYEPIRGSLNIEGRVTPLFELSMGMDQDSTGIENIRLRGRMLQIDRQVIETHIDEIAEFSQLGDYLYMPIRTYSAGMLVRLAFGISTSIMPEILLLDEMIGAGDVGFLERAQARLAAFIKHAGILVVATHGAGLLKEWCNKGMVLDKGRLAYFGKVDDAIEAYEVIVNGGAN